MSRYKVYYGWAKLGTAQKREALTVIFLNSDIPPRLNKDGKDGVTRYINICYERTQTANEQEDAKKANRVYTVYNLFMDSKQIKGSLKKALQLNFDADQNNVARSERLRILQALKGYYLSTHKEYRETGYQLEINFGE